jgi:lambda family phage portal protein
MRKKLTFTGRLKAAWNLLTRFDLFSEEAIAAFGGGAGGRLLMDWVTSSIHPDHKQRQSAARLRARARDLEEYNSYISQFLNLLAVNVVGPHGFKLDAQIKGSRNELLSSVNQKIEDAWYYWSCKPVTVDGRLNFIDLQKLLIRSVARDGEVFVRMWRNFPNEWGFALEPIDAEMVDERFNRSPSPRDTEVRMGIEVDRWQAAVAYHTWTRLEDTVEGINQRQRIRIPADEMIHLFVPKRIGQVRATTWLAPVMVGTKMLAGYTEAELVAARTAAAKMGFFVNKDGLGQSMDSAQGTASDTKSGTAMRMDAAPGTIGIAPAHYEFQTWDPTHPTSAFPAFMKTILREIATGLGVSYNALANDLEGVNYSSMRSGLLIERDIWRSLQTWWTHSVLTRVYENWLNMALLKGELALSGTRDFRAYRQVNWVPRGWAWVDPLKDVQAGVIAIQNGLASRTGLLGEQGEDPETIFKQLKKENEMALENEVQIAAPVPTIAPQEADPPSGPTTGANSGLVNGHATIQ